MQDEPETTCSMSLRHYDRVGVLAGVLNILREAKINIEQMDNKVFKGAKAACATLCLSQVPDPAVVKKISDMEDVITVAVK